MIGGIDVRLKTAAGRQALEAAVRAIRQMWPKAVFENAATGERYGYFDQIPFGQIDEIFVYRDDEVSEKWDEKGAIPETANTMIHVLYDEGLITVVIDERDEVMESALEAIRSALHDAIFSARSALEAV
jgi:hypothetical protein